jgi:general secretion pathway protein A
MAHCFCPAGNRHTSMYYRYFGLQEEPFSIAVNPKYLFMSTRHRDALAHLLYGVGAGGGFILLTGEVGTGKTTINRCLMQQLPMETDVAVILNPALNAEELLATVCDELEIDYEPGTSSLKVLTDHLHSFLLENHGRGRNTVLMIDEAQHLQFEVLEQIRLLTNLETNTRKLLQIILVGQPELSVMLAKPELRQLSQRITARYNLKPLDFEETDAYIRHRLQVAGLPANQELFPRSVVKGIYKYSRGIPRLINVLCGRMLLGTYGQNKPSVDGSMLRQAAGEVLGEETQAIASRKTWLWGSIAAVGIAALAAVLLWRPLLPGATLPMLISPADPPGQAVLVPPSEPEVASPTAVPAVVPTVVPTAVPAPVLPWLRQRGQAMAALSSWLGLESGVSGDPCIDAQSQGWRCETLVAESWDDLLEIDRPALLALLTPARFTASAVLVGISGENGLLLFQGEEVEFPLADLAPLWRGEFLIFWQPPQYYSEPLGLGDRGPMVGWLAREFARLDGQQRPLAEDEFNAALDARVRLFQRQFRLLDDGVVGMKTLLRLNSARGVSRSLQRTPTLARLDDS